MIELPNKSHDSLQKFCQENLNILHRYFVKKIVGAIKNDLEQVDLLKLPSGYIVFSKKENYISDIESSLQVFIQTEDYEAAQVTRSFLDGYYIDQLIKETSNH